MDFPVPNIPTDFKSGPNHEVATEFTEKLTELQTALLSQHPQLPTLLHRIHKQLKDDPEIVTILTEEQIGVIVQGISHVTNTKLTVDSAKAIKASLNKKIKNLTLDDLDL